MTHPYHPGQRWISESEPELGLGSVLHTSPRTVTLRFGASNETREYAREGAPLRRVRFRPGESVRNGEGDALVVRSLAERHGLIFYRDDRREWCETDLCETLSFSQPDERLLAGRSDPTELFDLRVAALGHQHRRRKSKVRGFVGGRIDLLPHQLHIASETAARLVPRVLLADEVGLGKTIEACLILHRLILTGRAQRVLILVPDSLVHQWFVELLRRFNLWFHIFDEERCDAIETESPGTNPFLEDQLVLASIRLFTGAGSRARQALDAGWDLLVVDEAHHLGWSPETVSPEYAAIDALGRQTPGLLLLTATPEQLGLTGHFARLRMLDPDRFHDLAEFLNEAGQYPGIARLSDKIAGLGPLTSGRAANANAAPLPPPAATVEKTSPLLPSDVTLLAGILAETEDQVRSRLGSAEERDGILNALLDQHGTGRVMFRNTRATIAGFPRRRAHLCPMDAGPDPSARLDALAEEFAADTDDSLAPHFTPAFSNDPRIGWLAALLRKPDPRKVLLICRTQTKVGAIEAALRRCLNVKIGVFHEGLSVVQRDRNAAWFAEEDGARLLICSEIGSEGRNFQFAQHLVMFDLPLDPELLEQRIGRLDRIGQTSEITIHIPFVTGSSQEVLVRWYHHEGLGSIEKNLHGGHELLEQFGERIHELARDFHETQPGSRRGLDRLLVETQTARKALTLRLEQGRDRLLELNSFRPETAATIVHEIQSQDGDQTLDGFIVSVFDHFNIHVEELAPRTYRLGSAGVFADTFPGLPTGGFSVTCDRQRALSREEIQFLTWDHPLVTGALDLLVGSEKGNSCFARWPDATTTGLYLETIHLLECIAPAQLHVDRFLPPTPLRVLVDLRGDDVGEAITPARLGRLLKNGNGHALLDRPEMREDLLPMLLEKAQTIAAGRVPSLVARARREMAAQLDPEMVRLRELQKVNRSVRPEEIELLAGQKRDLDQYLGGARLRLDSIRLIQRGP